jgi:1-acyl-sn-glycerol-3-phosphate acyltransferase
MENVPRTGPGLILSNHISHFDPPFMTAKFPRVVHFMADKPLLEIPVLGKLMKWGHVFPIDRTKNDRGAIKTALARLEAGNLVCIFPEGGIRHGKTSTLEGAELPIGTASLWRMADVPVIPMIILGSDQIYAGKKIVRARPRVFVRVGQPLPPDKNAPREELRDRVVAAWLELFDGMKRDYGIRPEELPQSAQARWAVPDPSL